MPPDGVHDRIGAAQAMRRAMQVEWWRRPLVLLCILAKLGTTQTVRTDLMEASDTLGVFEAAEHSVQLSRWLRGASPMPCSKVTVLREHRQLLLQEALLNGWRRQVEHWHTLLVLGLRMVFADSRAGHLLPNNGNMADQLMLAARRHLTFNCPRRPCCYVEVHLGAAVPSNISLYSLLQTRRTSRRTQSTWRC